MAQRITRLTTDQKIGGSNPLGIGNILIFFDLELVGLLGTKISPRLTQKGVFFTNFFDFDSFSRISPIFHKFELTSDKFVKNRRNL